MIDIPVRLTKPLSKATLTTLNSRIAEPISKQTILMLNAKGSSRQQTSRTPGNANAVPQTSRTPGNANAVPQTSRTPGNTNAVSQTVTPPSAPEIPDIMMPRFLHPLRKGQKTPLDPQNTGVKRLKVCFGWNLRDARCDMDASAFLTGNTGKVPADEWFVFYGQTMSPDRSVEFMIDPSRREREIINIDLQRLSPSIQKIVFVLTLNEAFEKNLNFSMIKDAYIRVLHGGTDQEIVSYQLDEYDANITSMTIGEIYLHNGQWKFNPVGNGVHQDLAGQCAIYGVETA